MVVIGDSPEGAEEQTRYIVFSEFDTGRALFALRDRALTPSDEPLCGVTDWGVGSGGLAVSVAFLDYDVTGDVLERSWMRVLRADIEALPESLRSLVHRDDWESLRSREMRLTETHVGLLFGASLPVLVGSDGTFVRPTFGTSDTTSKVNLVMTGETEMFWESWDVTKVLSRSIGDAPPEVIRAVAGGDVRGLSSDGIDFTWLEARGWDEDALRYDSVSLWTGSYDGAGLVGARRVSEVQGHADGAMGGGYYAHPEPDPGDPTHSLFGFYGLADGARAVIDPSPLPAARVFWVSEDDAVAESLGQRYRIDPRELRFE